MVKESKKSKENKPICGICNQNIIIPGEEFCILIQYKKNGELYKSMHYHVNCFKERFLANRKVDELTNRAMNLLSKAETRLA